MKVPFMSSYAKRLVQICHRHGAHAMGGMSAFIPSRRDEEVNKVAIEQVSQDKDIEVSGVFIYFNLSNGLRKSFECALRMYVIYYVIL